MAQPKIKHRLIALACDRCGFRFKVDSRFVGTRGECPNPECDAEYEVPLFPDAVDAAVVKSRVESANRRMPESRRHRSEAHPAKPAPSKAAPTSSTKSKSTTTSKSRRRTKVAEPPVATERTGFRFASRRTAIVAGAALLLVGAIGMFASLGPSNRSGNEVAQAAPQPPVDVYKTHVAPFLKKYCFDCHSADEPQAGLDFEKFPDEASVLKARKKWEKVLGMLEFESMPPGDHDPLPTADERKVVVDWVESKLYNLDCTIVRDPGRVTIRRLNRAEYNNTIRDLLAVDFKPASDFPSDDVGYGFDNIGDVLSISPLLMEKYLKAAEKISETAIVVQSPSRQHFEGNKLKPSKGVRPAARGFYSIASAGQVAAQVKFPSNGEYILRAEAAAQQAGSEVAKMEFRLGNRKLKVFEVKGNRDAKVYETTVKLSAGTQQFAAAFINDYYNPKARNPNDRDRNMYVRFLEVQGPLGAETDGLPESHRRLITCRPDDKRSVKDCAKEILQDFASRAFRRPATDEEVGRLVTLVEFATEQGDNFESAIRLGVQAVLVSPHFLFRVEDDRTGNDPMVEHAVGDYELASRLSYFLWSSMPDDELMELAKTGQLHRSNRLQQQVRRMLKDPRSRALVDNFATQWLNLGSLDEVTPDAKRFPAFNEKLRDDMRRETQQFFATVMREDRSILDFIDGQFTYVNARLAKHYGIPGISGEQFQRVKLDGKRRVGILTHASILTITSNPDRTAPVKRGKWIMENILGTSPPPPPPNVPELEETVKAKPNASLREQLELHRKDPGCASCHRQMDPLGFGFENFDAIGAWRDRDGKFRVDASGTLPGNQSFNGPAELAQILKKRSTNFSRCLTEKMLTYALGRGLEYYDRCATDKIVKALENNGYRFSTLVIEIVKCEPFKMRRGDGER